MQIATIIIFIKIIIAIFVNFFESMLSRFPFVEYWRSVCGFVVDISCCSSHRASGRKPSCVRC